MTISQSQPSSEGQDATVPLGIKDPFLPHHPLGQTTLNLQFMAPSGVQSISVLDTSIFSPRDTIQQPNLQQPFTELPFFKPTDLNTLSSPGIRDGSQPVRQQSQPARIQPSSNLASSNRVNYPDLPASPPATYSPPDSAQSSTPNPSHPTSFPQAVEPSSITSDVEAASLQPKRSSDRIIAGDPTLETEVSLDAQASPTQNLDGSSVDASYPEEPSSTAASPVPNPASNVNPTVTQASSAPQPSLTQTSKASIPSEQIQRTESEDTIAGQQQSPTLPNQGSLDAAAAMSLAEEPGLSETTSPRTVSHEDTAEISDANNRSVQRYGVSENSPQRTQDTIESERVASGQRDTSPEAIASTENYTEQTPTIDSYSAPEAAAAQDPIALKPDVSNTDIVNTDSLEPPTAQGPEHDAPGLQSASPLPAAQATSWESGVTNSVESQAIQPTVNADARPSIQRDVVSVNDEELLDPPKVSNTNPSDNLVQAERVIPVAEPAAITNDEPSRTTAIHSTADTSTAPSSEQTSQPTVTPDASISIQRDMVSANDEGLLDHPDVSDTDASDNLVQAERVIPVAEPAAITNDEPSRTTAIHSTVDASTASTEQASQSTVTPDARPSIQRDGVSANDDGLLDFPGVSDANDADDLAQPKNSIPVTEPAESTDDEPARTTVIHSTADASEQTSQPKVNADARSSIQRDGVSANDDGLLDDHPDFSDTDDSDNLVQAERVIPIAESAAITNDESSQTTAIHSTVDASEQTSQQPTVTPDARPSIQRDMVSANDDGLLDHPDVSDTDDSDNLVQAESVIPVTESAAITNDESSTVIPDASISIQRGVSANDEGFLDSPGISDANDADALVRSDPPLSSAGQAITDDGSVDSIHPSTAEVNHGDPSETQDVQRLGEPNETSSVQRDSVPAGETSQHTPVRGVEDIPEPMTPPEGTRTSQPSDSAQQPIASAATVPVEDIPVPFQPDAPPATVDQTVIAPEPDSLTTDGLESRAENQTEPTLSQQADPDVVSFEMPDPDAQQDRPPTVTPDGSSSLQRQVVSLPDGEGSEPQGVSDTEDDVEPRQADRSVARQNSADDIRPVQRDILPVGERLQAASPIQETLPGLQSPASAAEGLPTDGRSRPADALPDVAPTDGHGAPSESTKPPLSVIAATTPSHPIQRQGTDLSSLERSESINQIGRSETTPSLGEAFPVDGTSEAASSVAEPADPYVQRTLDPRLDDLTTSVPPASRPLSQLSEPAIPDQTRDSFEQSSLEDTNIENTPEHQPVQSADAATIQNRDGGGPDLQALPQTSARSQPMPDEWSSIADLLTQMSSSSSSSAEASSSSVPSLSTEAVSSTRQPEPSSSEQAYPNLHPFASAELTIQAKPDDVVSMANTASIPPELQAFHNPAMADNSSADVVDAGTSVSSAQLEQLAQAVYQSIKQRLMIERERYGSSYSGRLF